MGTRADHDKSRYEAYWVKKLLSLTMFLAQSSTISHTCLSHSQCSETCGFGTMSRSVSCVDTVVGGKEVSATECRTDSRPRTERRCQLVPCSAQWMAGDWGEVSGLILCFSILSFLHNNDNQPYLDTLSREETLFKGVH